MMFDVIELNQRIKVLEGENEMLREIIKDELYKEFIKQFGEPSTFAKIKNNNKKLKLKNKELEKIIEQSKR